MFKRTVRSLLSGFLLALMCTTALAHSTLQSSDPPDGAVITRPPATVTLTFRKAVTVTRVMLEDSRGQARALRLTANGPKPEWQLPLDVASTGHYTLTWRALSADGHPIKGVVSFTVEGE